MIVCLLGEFCLFPTAFAEPFCNDWFVFFSPFIFKLKLRALLYKPMASWPFQSYLFLFYFLVLYCCMWVQIKSSCLITSELWNKKSPPYQNIFDWITPNIKSYFLKTTERSASALGMFLFFYFCAIQRQQFSTFPKIKSNFCLF